jgi:hypothetical protein
MSSPPSFSPIPPQPGQQFDLPKIVAGLAGSSAVLTRIGDDAPLGTAGTAFPAIPVGGGRSLLVVGRVQGAAGTVDVGPQLNGDAANNYGFFNLFSAGAGANDGAAGVTNFLLAGQATAGTSCAFFCFIPGHRLSGLANVPCIAGCGSAAIVLIRGTWWNQGGPVTRIQVVASATMAVGSYAAVYQLGP